MHRLCSQGSRTNCSRCNTLYGRRLSCHARLVYSLVCAILHSSSYPIAVARLDKALFTSYNFTPPTAVEGDEQDSDDPIFQISLAALIETLQVFGVNEIKDRWPNRDPTYGGVSGSLSRGGPAAAFDSRVLGMTGVCRLRYGSPGDPLSVTLEETGVTTTCELVTYEPDLYADIPLQKDAIVQKIIMRASWLYDAITELSSTSPTRLTMTASPAAPYFSLSSSGPLGSATVEFSKDPQLLETFQVSERVVNIYKFSLIKGACRAMAIADKVSIRSDEQGVLSLQFLIGFEQGVQSFIDFRFVPFIPEEGEGDEEDESGNSESDDGAEMLM